MNFSVRIIRFGDTDARLAVSGKSRHGFTLLELIVVLFIISLLAALAIPSFWGITEKEVKSDARKTASLLRYLNDSAIVSKKNYSLTCDLQKHSLSWEGPEGEKSEELKSLKSITLQSKGEIQEGQVTVSFGPLGLQENIEIRLSDSNEEMTVAFNAVSGRAKVIEKQT